MTTQRPRQVLVPKDRARDEAESPTSPIDDGRAGHFQLRNAAELAVVADQAAGNFDRLPRGDCAQLHRELKGIRRLEGV